MKSKRSPFIVVTDDNIKIDMHFFADGTKGVIIECKRSDIVNLAKQAIGKVKFSDAKLKKYGRFVHLSPEISFFIK
jgi:hypothetical protein